MTKTKWRLIALSTVVCGSLVAPQAWAQAAGGISIDVLSSMPALVTGGDALVRITGSDTLPRVSLNGADVSAAFQESPAGGWVGLVEGLKDGENTLTAAPGGVVAVAANGEVSVTLVNHPINGTLFAGPQQKPFVCENETHGLAAATDETCAAPRQVAYSYRSTDGTWKPFDPNGPRPTDIEQTTTNAGKTVPLIVWRELGVINRAAYVLTLLHDPAAGPLPTPTANTTGWNGKLIYASRGGVQPGYHMGRTIGSLDAAKAYVGGENNNLHESLIRNGYALAGGSLNVTGTNTNHVVQAETMAKVKERFIELFGQPVFTIGMGTSGGSMSQHVIAQSYPGLMDGIMPWRSYADVITFQIPLNDCNLLEEYFKNSDLGWTDIQKTAVSGKLTFGYCLVPAKRFPNLRPDNCDPSVTDEKAYHPNDPVWQNVRCTYQDNLVNVYGVDPETGFARSPWDNVGVQYGLQALNDGIITFDQFVDLNAKIGGHDINGVIVPGKRAVGDLEAVTIAYATGRLNTGSGGLADVPILDIRGYTDGICTVAPCPPRDPTDVDVHDGYHTLVARARLQAANGHADNHVRLVTTEVGNRGPQSPVSIVSVRAVALLDQWLTDIVNDTSDKPQGEKVKAHRPAELVDACYTSADVRITDMETCAKLFPIASDARIVAGAPWSNDVLKCALKPVDAGDYEGGLSPEQLAKLQQAFPDGVCDYSQPGQGRVPLAGTWLTYAGDAKFQSLAAK